MPSSTEPTPGPGAALTARTSQAESPELVGAPGAAGARHAATARRPAQPAPWIPRRRGGAAWLPSAADALVVLAVIAVVLWQLHPSLLLSGSTTTGGDTGAHYITPAYFNTNLFPHLTGWDPSWYDGYPAYTFYFVLPDVLVALAAHVMSYNVAFKLATALGSVLLPLAAYACGRLSGLRRPVPAALAAATLPFLFDYSWTIYGGNLFSTLAGEYSYSLSLVFLVLFLGLFARGLRTGRHRAWAAIALAACVLAHVVPAVLALAGAAVLTLMELMPDVLRLHDGIRRPSAPRPRPWAGREGALTRPRALWWAVSTVGLGAALSAWWWVPFLADLKYGNSMNYTKVTTYVSLFFPVADLWALVLAGVGVMVAVVRRSRFGVLVAVLGGLSAVAVIFDPSRSLYNVRFLPLWFLAVYLLAGWVVGVALGAAARGLRRERLAGWAASVVEAGSSTAPTATATSTDPGPGPGRPRLRPRPGPARWAPGAVSGPLLALAGALAVVVPPFIGPVAAALPSIGVHPGPNEITNWSSYNYTGYEGRPDYPEYRGLMALMTRLGHRYGCGRALWEYNADENRFGTPEALMLLPYWTHGCIDSEEGLFFESSATVPYHFLNQAELSVGPSEAVVGLPYGPLTVHLGVEHLQLLGVRYYMAASPQTQQQAAADPTLRLVATSGPWNTTYDGERLSTTWKVYVVAHSPLVQPLNDKPAVLQGVGPGQTTWLGRIGPGASMTEGPSLQWYLDPSRWAVELTAGGPSGWPRVGAASALSAPAEPVPRTTVTDVHRTADSVSFRVSRTGTPVLVKVSYFPNWHATGAEGPWRATPNLMVVVPTSHTVTLTYGRAAPTDVGDLATAAGVVALAALFVAWLVARRRSHRGRSPALG